MKKMKPIGVDVFIEWFVSSPLGFWTRDSVRKGELGWDHTVSWVLSLSQSLSTHKRQENSYKSTGKEFQIFFKPYWPLSREMLDVCNDCDYRLCLGGSKVGLEGRPLFSFWWHYGQNDWLGVLVTSRAMKHECDINRISYSALYYHSALFWREKHFLISFLNFLQSSAYKAYYSQWEHQLLFG